MREYAQIKPVEEAVEQAISECIQEGIMAEFLKQNRAEAKQVSIYEYDEEKHMRQEREASWEEGREVGREEGREEGRVQGREEGKFEGKIELLRMQIQKKLVNSMGKFWGQMLVRCPLFSHLSDHLCNNIFLFFKFL